MSEIQENDLRSREADAIIRKFVMYSAGAGLIPIPVADFFAVSAVQLEMIRRLCKLYDISFKDTEVKAAIMALTSSGIARIGGRMITKMIPFIGSIVGGVAVSAFSGATSYALGEVFKRHFEDGGTFLDFDWKSFKRFYDEKFEKGKEYAKKIKDDAEEEIKSTGKKLVEATEETLADIKRETKKTVKKANTPKSKNIKAKVKNLQELYDMRKSGEITAEEYDQKKTDFLDLE